MHLAPHAVNVFIPLVALREPLGPTEFAAGSHTLTNTSLRRATVDALCRCDRVKVTCAAGDAIVFDYRTLHRGTANVTVGNRPLLCLVYTRRWFMDADNYPPHSMRDVAGQRASMTKKLALIFPGAGGGRGADGSGGGGGGGGGGGHGATGAEAAGRAALEESEWNWTAAMALMTSRSKAAAKAKREASKARAEAGAGAGEEGGEVADGAGGAVATAGEAEPVVVVVESKK